MTAQSLTDDEIARIKTELWDHVLDTGAEPWIGFHPIYNTIRDHVLSSSVAATSSQTILTVTTAPLITTITVADPTGISAGIKLVLDCDDSRETCTVRSISGSVVGVNVRKNHGAAGPMTWPVEIESPRTIVRGILFDLGKLELSIADAMDSAGIKRADEVEFFGPNDGGGVVAQMMANQTRLRLELARRIGLDAYVARKAGGSSYEQY